MYLPHDPARPCRPKGGFDLVKEIIWIFVWENMHLQNKAHLKDNLDIFEIIQTLSRPNGHFLLIRTLYISYGLFADHLDTFQHCWQGFSYPVSNGFTSSLQPPYVLKRYDISGDLLFSYRATPFTSYCKTGKGAFLAYNYLQEKLSFFQCWMQSCSLFWFLGR